MATIKDIAALAGVSHGTVSNVLNGRGNVSVEKITLVEQAAKQLGYTINAQARQLRKGSSKRVGVILPDITREKYRNLFLGLQRELEKQGYEVDLYCTGDIRNQELKVLQKAEMTNPLAIVIVSADPENAVLGKMNCPIIFVECCKNILEENELYFGFDYEQAGYDIAERCLADGHKKIAIFTGSTENTQEAAFLKGIHRIFEKSDAEVQEFHSGYLLAFQTAFDLFGSKTEYDAVITSSTEYADYVREAGEYRCDEKLPVIYTVAEKDVMEHSAHFSYRLNSQLGGRKIAECICKLAETESWPAQTCEIKADGFVGKSDKELLQLVEAETLKILMLTGPTCRALKQLLPRFERKTGIRVILMEAEYDELHRMVQNCVDTSPYDLIRMDMAWVPELGTRVYAGLSEEETWVKRITEGFSEKIGAQYFEANGEMVCLPFDPSVQLFYYRKDLFEDPRIRREFYEANKYQLEVPKTFEEYDVIARFFTRKYNPSSPVEFGTSMIFGNSIVAACDYLPRLKALDTAEGTDILDTVGEDMNSTLEAYKSALDYTDHTINGWWGKAMEDFSEGRAAMNIVFANYASMMLRNEKTECLGNIGFAPVPGGCPMLGGGVIGISRYSGKQDAAARFLQWVYDENTAAMITYLGGYINHKNLKNNLDILNLYPWMESMEEAFSSGWRGRKNDPEVGRIEEIIGNAVRAVVSGVLDTADAVEMIRLQINGL